MKKTWKEVVIQICQIIIAALTAWGTASCANAVKDSQDMFTQIIQL